MFPGLIAAGFPTGIDVFPPVGPVWIVELSVEEGIKHGDDVDCIGTVAGALDFEIECETEVVDCMWLSFLDALATVTCVVDVRMINMMSLDK